MTLLRITQLDLIDGRICVLYACHDIAFSIAVQQDCEGCVGGMWFVCCVIGMWSAGQDS